MTFERVLSLGLGIRAFGDFWGWIHEVGKETGFRKILPIWVESGNVLHPDLFV
jgi:hypothetical protein